MHFLDFLLLIINLACTKYKISQKVYVYLFTEVTMTNSEICEQIYTCKCNILIHMYTLVK